MLKALSSMFRGIQGRMGSSLVWGHRDKNVTDIRPSPSLNSFMFNPEATEPEQVPGTHSGLCGPRRPALHPYKQTLWTPSVCPWSGLQRAQRRVPFTAKVRDSREAQQGGRLTCPTSAVNILQASVFPVYSQGENSAKVRKK